MKVPPWAYLLLLPLAVVIYQTLRRWPEARSATAASPLACVAALSRVADRDLAELGHHLDWGWASVPPTAAGTCDRCGGVVRVTTTDRGGAAADYGDMGVRGRLETCPGPVST